MHVLYAKYHRAFWGLGSRELKDSRRDCGTVGSAYHVQCYLPTGETFRNKQTRGVPNTHGVVNECQERSNDVINRACGGGRVKG